MEQYPKWLYHKEKDPVIVADEKAHKELGKGWAESPAEFEAKEEAPKAKAKSKKKAE